MSVLSVLMLALSLPLNSCWLSTEEYTIYFFAAPAAAILIVSRICVLSNLHSDSFFGMCDDVLSADQFCISTPCSICSDKE